MRTRFFISGLVACLFVLGTLATGLAQDLKLTGCINKKGKLRRVEIGTEPQKGDCKSNHTLIMIPLTNKTDQLMEKDIELMEKDLELMAKDDELMAKDSEQDTAIDANAAAIDEITAGLISSMIGGGHSNSTDGDAIFYMPLYNWFRLDTNEEAASKVAVTGWLTDLVVVMNEPVGADARQTFSYVVNGDVVNVDPIGPCEIMGDNTMCQSTGCARIEKGDMLSVRVVAEDLGSSPNVSPTRWTGRFVETDELCPILEP